MIQESLFLSADGAAKTEVKYLIVVASGVCPPPPQDFFGFHSNSFSLARF